MKFWVDRLSDEKGIASEAILDSLEDLMALFDEEGDLLITEGEEGRPGIVIYGAYEDNARASKGPKLKLPDLPMEYDRLEMEG